MNTTDNKQNTADNVRLASAIYGEGSREHYAFMAGDYKAQRDAAVAALRDLADNLDVEAVARARAIIAAVESESQ